MAFFPQTNVYSNHEALKAWYSTFAIFALWWVFRLISDLFEHRHSAAPVNNGAVAPVATNVHHRRLHRITTGLRDVFISSFAVVTLNYLTNGITRNFNIIYWIVLWVGLFWALLRAFGRIGHFIGALPVIALFVLLWWYALVHRSYSHDEL